MKFSDLRDEIMKPEHFINFFTHCSYMYAKSSLNLPKNNALKQILRNPETKTGVQITIIVKTVLAISHQGHEDLRMVP